jgi:hypothetical protein
MYWFGADLYYANANYFAEQARMLGFVGKLVFSCFEV